MQFDNIPGKQALKKEIIKAIRQDHVGHAQLYFGEEGNGVMPLARATAQYMSCKNPTDSDSCGVCSNCKQIQALSHPDLHLFFPIPGGQDQSRQKYLASFAEAHKSNPHLSLNDWFKTAQLERKQAIINVRQSEEIARAAQLESYSGGNKYLFIWIPERLHSTASNKLLKLLEEPPSRTYFFLISVKSESLLDTITSRCQKVYIPPYSSPEILSHLKNENIEFHLAQSAAELSEGNLSLALQYAQQSEELLQNAQAFKFWSRACYTASSKDILNWVEDNARLSRDHIKLLLTSFMKTIGVSFHSRYKQTPENLSLYEAVQFDLSKFAPFISINNSPNIHQLLEEALYDIQRNVNPKMVLFDMSIKMSRLLRQA